MNAVWYLGGVAAAAAIGWLAALLHSHDLAPILLLPLAAGLALGFSLRKLSKALNISRRHAIAGAVLFALVAVFAEHAWLYQDFRRQWQVERDANPRVAMFRPAEPLSPREYFQREATRMRTAFWCLDAAVLVTSTVAVVAIQRKKFVVADDAKPLTPDT